MKKGSSFNNVTQNLKGKNLALNKHNVYRNSTSEKGLKNYSFTNDASFEHILLDPFCQCDFVPIWDRSINTINRSVPIFQIDRYELPGFLLRIVAFFRSIWKRFNMKIVIKGYCMII